MNPTIASIALPEESRLHAMYETAFFADAFAVALPSQVTADAETLARCLFEQQPRWVGVLMRLRDALVAGFGLKTAAELRRPAADGAPRRINIFRIYDTSAHEIVLGEDDRHLDFRVSVLRRESGAAGRDAPSVTVCTVVHCHNRLGRNYIRLIAPFHRMVVKAGLRQAARAGWRAR